MDSLAALWTVYFRGTRVENGNEEVIVIVEMRDFGKVRWG